MQSEDVKRLLEEKHQVEGTVQVAETSVMEDLTNPQGLEGDCVEWDGHFYQDGRPRKYLPGGRDVIATRWLFTQRNGLLNEDIKGQWVIPACENKQCVNAQHLYLTTNKPYHFKSGEKNSNSKLTEEDIIQIRQEYRRSSSKGVNHDGNGPELMKRYGITATHLSKIVLRKTWAHVI